VKFSATEPGIVVSGVAHVAMLLATLVVFSEAPKFDEAQESVPVEIVTDQQFNQIMKGEKTAKETKPLPPRADKVAEVSETKPTPVRNEAKVDTAAPPINAKREPDPGEDEKPVPTPPQRVAALPKPDPVKPEPPILEPPLPTPRPPEKAEPKAEPPKDAEAVEPPKPPQRPKEEPKKVEKVEPPTPPKIPPKPKDERPKLDQVAKLLEQKKLAELSKPASKPKSGDETQSPARPDPAAIAKLLSREPSQQRASTGSAVNQTASIGTPTANAPKMSPSLWGQLDGLLQDQYKQCWSYLGLSSGQRYIPQIKVEYSRDGSLVGQPALLNPPSDPALRSLADSAVRAVRRCNPLRIPAQYTPYYEQWRARILRFDPEEMAG
jgi:colicin import membrane protein